MSEKSLKKELKSLDVYAIAMGTTLSSGFFLLPGLAYAESGSALVLCYVLAALLAVPAIYAMVELSTAMPKSGGAYYFLDRSMGPLVGTIGGLGTWVVLILKSAFALIGLGAYLGIFFPLVPIVPLAVGLALGFGVLNLIGTKKTGAFQVVLVLTLIVILVWFVFAGVPKVELSRFTDFFDTTFESVFATTGLVYISYAGLTKVTGVAEEVHDPEKNIVRGMMLALVTAVAIYAVGTFVIVGVVPGEVLSGALTPVAAAAELIVGRWGVYLVTVAAVLGFFAAANAGVLSASRYPMAMSRDRLLPGVFKTVSGRGVPSVSVYATVGMIIVCLVLLDPSKIAKLAGAFQLVMFSLLCLAVIVMRESGLKEYDPGFKSPLYPWMQIFGIVAPLWIITQMGTLPILFTIGLLMLGIVWYLKYASRRTSREGATFHWFAQLGRRRYQGLETELRSILKEKGLRDADPFDEIVARCFVIDIKDDDSYDDVVAKTSALLATRLPATAAEIQDRFLDGTRVGMTPVAQGVGLPHFKLSTIDEAEMVIVRSRGGLPIDVRDIEGNPGDFETAHALFFLVSPEHDPSLHLRILAEIAGRVDEKSFSSKWLAAEDEQGLKEVLLRDERFLVVAVRDDLPSRELIGRTLRESPMPDGALVAFVRRGDEVVVPRGSTIIEKGDRLTLIGEPDILKDLAVTYLEPDVVSGR